MDPGTAIAVGQVSAKVLSLIWRYYSDVKDAKNDIQRLVGELQDLRNVFQKCEEVIQKSSLATKPSASAPLNNTTEQALSDVKVLEGKLDPGTGKKTMNRLGVRALKWPFEKDEVDEWIAKFERHKTLLNLALSMDETSLMYDVDNNIAQLRLGQEVEEQNRQLGKLRIAGDASYDAYHRQHKAQCTIDTRVELLRWLQDWAAKHERPIFWLSGMAGTGKSTIALTLAHKLNNIKSLGATFFFSRASGSSKSAANFVGTLAYDLAKTIPQYKDLVCEAISGNTDVLRQGLRNQWEVLIIGPLSKIKLSRRLTMNVIIDALDECDSDDNIKLILQLLVEAKDLSTVDLGVFVTSRPEVAMRLGFGNMTEIFHETLDLRDVPRQTVENDIAVFLRHELRRISQDHKLHDWPSQGDIQSLVERADGLFIYAATVCGFVEDKNWDPQERLFEVLRGGSAEVGGTVQLDEMYREVLRCALTKNRREGEVIRLCDRFKQVVGSIVTLSDTLSVSALANLLNIRPRNVELALGSLHSVLNIPKDSEIPVRLLHPSFHDFLSGEARCEDRRFFVNKVSVHGRLFTSCLKTMSVALKRNMCNLKLPGSSPQDIQNGMLDQLLPRYVQYACQYWLEHLACARHQQWSDLGLCDEGTVHRFFQQKYLYWLEAMCLMDKVSEAVLMVAKLGAMIGRDKSPALYSLIVDANRFNLSNRGIIEEAPLQIYAAALVFAPKESLIRKCYRDHFPAWLTRVPVVNEEWGSTLQILEGHRNSVDGVAFSPDGKYLASASGDCTVRLWDPATGALRSTLAGHSGAVIAVAFSNNCQLATASRDETLRIWDYISGVTRHVVNFASPWDSAPPLSYRLHIAFAPNGSLAIGSQDGKLHAWNPDTAFLTTANFAKFSEFGAETLEFSPKGHLVFSWGIGESYGREDEILSYEPDTASTHVLFSKTSTSHRELPAKAKALAFSADDQMALALDNGTIALWDMAKDSHIMLDCAQKITALAFSPNNQSLVVAVSVSSSLPNSLRFWDLSTHTESLIGMLASEVDNVTFSPDGRQLAFAYRYGRTVQLWDPLTKPANNIREGHTTRITSLVFSRDGRYLASLAQDYVIRIWYPVSGKLRHALTGHSKDVLQVVFSPDSQQIASTSTDGTVRLWDPVEGTLHHILPRDVVTTPDLVYTNDGKELACGFSGGVIRIWSSAKGELIQTLHGHSLQVRMAAFSPNGQMVAARSEDGVFIVWDRPKGGDPLFKQSMVFRDEDPPNWYRWSVAFSNDGQYLVSTSGTGAVAIWDPTKGELVKTFKSPDVLFDGLIGRTVLPAFSPDNQLLAVKFGYKFIRIWHVATGENLETFQNEHTVMDLSFSADGTYLQTNRGELDIGGLLEDPQRSSHSSGFRWNILGDWLMQGSRKMLWLPPDFREGESAYRDGLFALGRDSGPITFLGVDLDYRPPG